MVSFNQCHLRPNGSSPEQGSQSVKLSFGTNISMGRPKFDMPAWGNVIFANLLTITKMEWGKHPDFFAYDNPTSGKTVIIVIHQAIHVPMMECDLICPMQVRMNDVKLDDEPKFLTDDPTNESHAISSEDDIGTLISITLELKVVTSYSLTRKPTMHEFDKCPRIE